jgi:signal peptidase I
VVAGFVARGYLVFLGTLALVALLPALFGQLTSVIEGGSMEPHISVGDVVISVPLADDADVPMGRVVAFNAADGSAREGRVTHRIVAANDDGSLVTAGDANAQADSEPLAAEAILGQGMLLVPAVGLPVYWLDNGELLPFLIFCVVTLGAIIIEVGTTSRTRPARHKAVAIPVAVALAVFGAVVPLSTSAATPSSAAFTGQTQSLASNWTYAAAKPGVRLAFTTQPAATATGGVAFTRQPVVSVLDAAGAVTTTTKSVTLALTNAAGAAFACSALPVVSTSGVASFAGCSITKSGTYTLTATASGLTSAASSSIVVSVGPAAALRFVAVPGATAATAPFSVQPIVEVVDAGGNRTTSTAAVTLSLTNAGGATLTCGANPRAAVSGLSTFTLCRIDKAGAYTLTAKSGALTATVSASFNVTPVPALTCSSSVWMATYAWSPTPNATTTYRLYVNGVQVAATGADGWNSYVQLTSSNVPYSVVRSGTASVLVTKILASGVEQTVGTGSVTVGSVLFRTYTCG